MPCNEHGIYLPPNSPPPVQGTKPDTDWSPFLDHLSFELADFLYWQEQMSAGHIDALLQILAASLQDGDKPSFANHADLYKQIDFISAGNIEWSCATIQYTGSLPSNTPPPWMSASYEVWYREPHAIVRRQLTNPEFKDQIDYVPRKVYDENGKCIWSDFMTRGWAWEQAASVFFIFPLHCMTMAPK